eukprot:TRINITY_DN319_c0_g1_i1.p1 TRINITY_DN319_c0_g1~~TRINITY_DN319_c0_g1_i1.p1  ORF type:complete len:660 (+),score=158.08 TRINITY_DN319_c0_g1_i1:35-1981(+)
MEVAQENDNSNEGEEITNEVENNEETTNEVENNEETNNDNEVENSEEQEGEQGPPNLVVCLLNVPKKFGSKRVQKEIGELNLQGVLKIKKRPNLGYAHVTFANLEAKEAGVYALRRFKIHDRKINVVDSQRNKGKNRNDKRKKFEKYEEDNGNDEEKGENKRPKTELTVHDVVTPLHRHPYETQLQQKKAFVIDKLKGIVRNTSKLSAYNVPQWVNQAKDKLCCPLVRLYSSPVTKGYRNKSSLTIGLDKDNQPMIGFAMGLTKDGITTVGDPSSAVNMSDRTEEVRKAMLQCVVESGRATWDKVAHLGFWRELTIRVCDRTNQVMAIMQANPTGLSEEELQTEEERMIKYFSTVSNIEESSLQVQYWSGLSNVASYDTPIKSLLGPTHITEILMGLKFRISANSFFQPNTAAAEVLYKVVGDWATVNPETTVLDIYCGTGTIGLSLAKQAKLVVGVEEVEDAIKDAYQNAANNGIKNVEYFVGKAEHQLASILSQHGENCVAIVDPPRPGLHSSAIQAIRDCSTLKKLIYVSCNQNSLVVDAAHLCRSPSKTMPGLPFVPVKCAVVDLFPHTAHLEVVMLFERITAEDTAPPSHAVTYNPSEPVIVRMDNANMGMLTVDSVLPDPVSSTSTDPSSLPTEEEAETNDT